MERDQPGSIESQFVDQSPWRREAQDSSAHDAHKYRIHYLFTNPEMPDSTKAKLIEAEYPHLSRSFHNEVERQKQEEEEHLFRVEVKMKWTHSRLTTWTL